jgi:hypothetical protein
VLSRLADAFAIKGARFSRSLGVHFIKLGDVVGRLMAIGGPRSLLRASALSKVITDDGRSSPSRLVSAG